MTGLDSSMRSKTSSLVLAFRRPKCFRRFDRCLCEGSRPDAYESDVSAVKRPTRGRERRRNSRRRIARANHRNNVLFSSTVEVPSFRGHLKAFNIYR